jgi:putative membrane protein
MIRLVAWVLKVLAVLSLFLALLGFAVKNTEPVVVRYYFSANWQAPLVVVILAVFAIGAAAGILAMSGQLLRQRRELTRLRRQSASATDQEAA